MRAGSARRSRRPTLQRPPSLGRDRSRQVTRVRVAHSGSPRRRQLSFWARPVVTPVLSAMRGWGAGVHGRSRRRGAGGEAGGEAVLSGGCRVCSAGPGPRPMREAVLMTRVAVSRSTEASPLDHPAR